MAALNGCDRVFGASDCMLRETRSDPSLEFVATSEPYISLALQRLGRGAAPLEKVQGLTLVILLKLADMA